VTELSERERRYFVQLRIAAALQEVGVLEFVFAPLDFAVDSRPLDITGPTVALFVVAGVLLFALGVALERRFR